MFPWVFFHSTSHLHSGNFLLPCISFALVLKLRLNEIIQYLLFGVWLLLFNVMFFKVIMWLFDLVAHCFYCWGFPGKESACLVGDPGSIPGSGRSPEEEISYPLQFSWDSLVAQTVKNPPAIWETWVQVLGWKDPVKEGMATHSSILAWEIPWRSLVGYSPWSH